MPRKKKLKPLSQFGKNLKKIRTKAGLSQEKLAILVGIHRTTIGELERGEQNPSLINLIKIADALKVELTDLFTNIKTSQTTKLSNQEKPTDDDNTMNEPRVKYIRQPAIFAYT